MLPHTCNDMILKLEGSYQISVPITDRNKEYILIYYKAGTLSTYVNLTKEKVFKQCGIYV